MLRANHSDLVASSDLADAVETLRAAEVDPDAERHRRTILDFVTSHDDVLHRSCLEGHLTGSALVVDAPGEHVLLLFHTKLQRWLQPGGHCDGDANLAAVALREATEESGIEDLAVDPVAVDLDVHEVAPPTEGPHLHLDARFLVVAPPGAQPQGNHESEAIRWVPRSALADYDLDAGTIRMVRHGLARRGRLTA
ncbi:MAG: NUDIX hydrolase [Acidimicrobiales bacterium]|nr:NUDIX hydrolase [Acidimicrobiales bacterium]